MTGLKHMTDQDKYLRLIAEVKEYYESGAPELRNYVSDKTVFGLEWCPGLEKEINLWTYWQGGNRENGNMSADIILIGQDFGPVTENGQIKQIYKNCLSGIQSVSERYIEEITKNKKHYITDNNLIAAFFSLGDEYRADKPNPKLFFTNLCLGYRSKEKLSGGDFSYQMRHDSVYLKELFSILKPKVAICIGANTYISALAGLLDKESLESISNNIVQLSNSFNIAMDRGNNHIRISYEGGSCEMFAVGHTGFWGINNRKKYTQLPKNQGKEAIDVMINDWQAIKKYL